MILQKESCTTLKLNNSSEEIFNLVEIQKSSSNSSTFIIP